jgi:hypothetical protein
MARRRQAEEGLFARELSESEVRSAGKLRPPEDLARKRERERARLTASTKSPAE